MMDRRCIAACGKSALARSSPRGHPPLQRPTRSRRAAPWGLRGAPSPIWVPRSQLRRRSGASPKVADRAAFEPCRYQHQRRARAQSASDVRAGAALARRLRHGPKLPSRQAAELATLGSRLQTSRWAAEPSLGRLALSVQPWSLSLRGAPKPPSSLRSLFLPPGSTPYLDFELQCVGGNCAVAVESASADAVRDEILETYRIPSPASPELCAEQFSE